MNKRALVAAILVGVLGCDRKETDGTATAVSAVPSATTTAPAIGSASPKAAKPAVATELAQATLTAWVDAQNRNSFEDYKVLYGEPFVGIKRTGNVEKQFQLAGWLEDRRQLFQRNPLVAVENVKVMTTASTAIVEFDQTWKTARFQDFGRKRLVFNRDAKDGKLRIGREEMLTSTAGAAKIVRPELPPGAHYFIKKTTGGFGAVLGLMGQAKATGKFMPVEWGLTQRAVNLDTAKRASELIGTEIDVYPAEGVPCLTKVSGIVAIAEAMGGIDEGDLAAAEQTWNIAGETATFLVADLRPVKDPCAAPMWGRLASLSKPLVYETRKATADELQRGILALHRTAQGIESQKAYLEAKKVLAPKLDGPYRAALLAPDNWYESEPNHSATVITNPKTKESYISVEGSAMGGPCGGLYVIATFKITDQNLIEITPPAPMVAAREIGYNLVRFLPDSAVQLPEVTQPILFNRFLLYLNNGTGWVPAKHASGPRLICGC
jgi:hypothetical protein